jgi:hypothetical protein
MKIQTLSDPPRARYAILGFNGWADAGKLVEAILAELREMLHCYPLATLDMDGFWNVDSVRPVVNVQHGQIQALEWPTYRFYGSSGTNTEPVLIGMGPEPTCHWRLFTQELLESLRNWGCKEIYLLGSRFDQIFHDEIVISSVVQNERSFNLVREMDCEQSEYHGPSSIHSAIMEAARDMDIECLCLWAHIPFYVSGPHQLVMAECIRILGRIVGVALDPFHLVDIWRGREKEFDDLIEQDQKLRQAVESMKKEKQLRASSSKVLRMENFLRKRRDQPLEED